MPHRLHTPEPEPPFEDPPPQPKPTAPPFVDERGPQTPVELPGQPGAPERAWGARV
jgi:hypothetical protein